MYVYRDVTNNDDENMEKGICRERERGQEDMQENDTASKNLLGGRRVRGLGKNMLILTELIRRGFCLMIKERV